MRKRLPLFLGVLIIFGLWLATPVFFNETLVDPALISWSGVATAQEGGVVSCGPGTSQRECDICGLYQTGYNIIRLGFFLVEPIVVLMIIIGGILYITSTGYEERVDIAKKTITGAVTGLVIIFVAYAAVKAITTAFGYSQNILDAVDCSQFEGTVVSGGEVTQTVLPAYDVCEQYGFQNNVCTWAAANHPQGVDGLVDPATLTAIPNTYLAPSSVYSTRYAVSKIANALPAIESYMSSKGFTLSTQKGSKTWRVTEAYPPTVEHGDNNHYDGGAIDITVYDENAQANPDYYDILWQAVVAAGLRPVNESTFTTEIIGKHNEYPFATAAHLHVEAQ